MNPAGERTPAAGRGLKAGGTSRAVGAVAPTSLPIRLSVAQGGLGIELSTPVKLPSAVVEELDVALIGVNYPIDLSKGVKQFRNRRSRLRRAVIRIDLKELSVVWSRALASDWGDDVQVRLRPVFVESEGESVSDAFLSGAPAPANEAGRPVAVAVSVFSSSAALAFDLVFSSGDAPRFVVDCPRVTGRKEPALALSLRCIDAAISQMTSDGVGLKRQGRSLEMGQIAQAMTLAVLPHLGCRLPTIDRQTVQEVSAERGSLTLTLGLRSEPISFGRRALLATGLADFVSNADELLSSGDSEGARKSYLEALESAEGHPGILLELSELDLAAGTRAESALSFLGELESRWGTEVSTEWRCRFELALGRALSLTGREESAFEALQRAFQIESDGAFAAVLAIELSVGSQEPTRKRAFLDWGVGRAPFHQGVRLARFYEALKQGELEVALADGDRIEAMASAVDDRARKCVQIGRALSEHGHPEWGRRWLTRALRLTPDDPTTLLALAEALRSVGKPLRAAELLQITLRHLEDHLAAELDEGETLPLQKLRVQDALSQRARARYELATLLVELEVEPSQALGLLSGVDTRSEHGVSARILEAEVHNGAGRELSRDRVLSRLLEGIELGWVDLETLSKSAERFDRLMRTTQDQSLVRFAERVTQWRVTK